MTEIQDHRLTPQDCVLIVVDVQERMMNVIPEGVRENTIRRIGALIETSKRLEIPVLVSEQYPQGLGPTVAEISRALPDFSPIEKISFSCCGARPFLSHLKKLGRNKVMLTGVETHICCFQTALDLLGEGFIVHTVADALCSRAKLNWRVGLSSMERAGALPTTTEQALFDLLRVAGTEDFKALSPLIR